MVTALCKSTVLKIYQEVIGDVITNVEEIFNEDGVDSQVLQQLRQTWEARLLATKAVDIRTDTERAVDNAKAVQKRISQQNVGQVANAIPLQGQQPQMVVGTKMVQIHIKLPVEANSGKQAPVLTVQIPQTVIEQNQLQKVLTGNLIASLLTLPTAVATSVLQQQINAAFLQQPAINKIAQGDGNYDSSEDEDDLSVSSPQPRSAKKFKPSKKSVSSDISDDEVPSDDYLSADSEVEKQPDIEIEDAEPLNSDDDVSDAEQSDLFDVENVIVCQYDKITRHRNKWKFHMKAGIMNLNGEDFIFEKINGDAEW